MNLRAYRAGRRVGCLMILTVALLATIALVGRSAADVGPEGEWVPTGPPAGPTGAFGTLMSLQDGTALLIGQPVQRYDPNTGGWTPSGSLLGNGGVPTLLANGKVLVTGLSPAEVYDPVMHTSTLTGAMIIPRSGHQATLLASGDVLVSGGVDPNNQLIGPAEIYHSATGAWTLTGTMNNPRRDHTAVLVPTDKVLATSGSGGTSAELYDPTTGTWTLTGSNSVGGTAVSAVLLDGTVLVVNGAGSQIFDSPTGTWSPPTAVDCGIITLFEPCTPRAAARLNDGRVLVIWTGRYRTCDSLIALLFDPMTGWIPANVSLNPDAMATGEATRASLAALRDGRALLTSLRGCTFSSGIPGAQLFQPDNAAARLVIDPTTLDFGNVTIGAAVQRTITVQNIGQATLIGSATLSNSPGFTVLSGASYDLGAGASSPTVVAFSSSAPGTFTGTVTFMSNGGQVSVPLTAAVGIMLSGRIAQTSGAGVPSVPVELHGTFSGSTTTDENGAYSFFVQPGTYTLVPASPTLTFSPPSRTVTVSAGNVTGLDFEVPTVLQAAVLPSSRSVAVGTAATAFATIINSGATPATSCEISRITSVPATLMYQTTDPSTNAVTGTPNTPVPISGGGMQTFVFALTPTGPFPPTDVQLSFDCTNTNPAPILPGVNTLLLSASTAPTPDIVALLATLNNDGIVNVPNPAAASPMTAPPAAGVFAVATVNAGAGGMITISADTGGAPLPLSIVICQTVTATGACQGQAAPSVTTQINAGTTPTFGIFVTATGTVPFDPANNRIFVRFTDAAGVTRGATSVAVRTQ